jgi:hypothetical protein
MSTSTATVAGGASTSRRAPRNADTARRHLDSVLLAKPVALLTHKDLADLRKKLVAGRGAATVNRVTTA